MHGRISFYHLKMKNYVSNRKAGRPGVKKKNRKMVTWGPVAGKLMTDAHCII